MFRLQHQHGFRRTPGLLPGLGPGGNWRSPCLPGEENPSEHSEKRGSLPSGCARSWATMPDHRRALPRPGTEAPETAWRGGFEQGLGSWSWL